MFKRLSLIALAASMSMGAAAAGEYYVKNLTFPAGATPEQKLEMASRLIPSQRQLDWQKLEMTAFIHFGVNTFTDREWGDGTENPAIFNPWELDADQWVKALRDGGFKLVILTAKHHDGFCLWPTATTEHCVRNSPWKDGKGDVMAELRAACDKYGLKLGVYLSPWDRNAACYGNSPVYNDMFVAQLTELLTKYGKIDEVWFDGANGEGPNGKKQVYDWDRFAKVIQELQPNAVMAIMGDDVRWVGNEKGMGRETEWSATAITPGIYPNAGESNQALGLFAKAQDLGSRDIVAKADRLYWWPSEVDVSIRPGWFWHLREQPKSLRQLAEIYLNSVGRNSVLLLNIPPDTRGRIADEDVARIAELKKWIDSNFSNNLIDSLGRLYKPGSELNAVVLKEDISKGQHVEKFSIEALVKGKWTTVANGTTIGHKRILTFSPVRPTQIRLKVIDSRGEANIESVEAYNIALPAEVNVSLPGYRAVPNTDWSISACTGPKAAAYSAIDDSETIAWRSPSQKGSKYITVDMKRPVSVAGFTYKPRKADDVAGTVYHYTFETSMDGKNWTLASTPGEFSNIMHNPLPQSVYFPTAAQARYFRFTALDEVDNRDYVTVGEIGVLTSDAGLAPIDDETALWRNPAAKLNLKPGQKHPKAEGWKFYTAHEFNAPDGPAGLPAGWRLQNGAHVARYARVDTSVYSYRGGYLRMESRKLPAAVDNGHGRKVQYSTYALRTPAPQDSDHWCNFTENMRVEVRARRSSTTGINDALWFMDNSRKPWPSGGEIDLLENPKKNINNVAHFTLHTTNHHAKTPGGAVNATARLRDMADWNIYWMEILPDRIRGGINGKQFFEHIRGAGGNTDWPWNDPEGFFMLMTSGLSTNPKAWPGAVDSAQWDASNPPHMDVDWIRVFVNDDYKGAPAPAAKFY